MFCGVFGQCVAYFSIKVCFAVKFHVYYMQWLANCLKRKLRYQSKVWPQFLIEVNYTQNNQNQVPKRRGGDENLAQVKTGHSKNIHFIFNVINDIPLIFPKIPPTELDSVFISCRSANKRNETIFSQILRVWKTTEHTDCTVLYRLYCFFVCQTRAKSESELIL